MRVRSKLPALEGRRLTTEMTVHNNDFGGVTVVVYGSKGSGKTTLFLTLCQTVQCYNTVTNNLELETSIWRGGDEDYWTWLPYERTRVFIHRDNIDTVSFKCDENLMEYDRSQLPPITVYKNNKDLYSKLLRGGINVIYEPTTYTLTDRLKKMIQKRGVAGDELFKKKEVDSIIWWFEFVDWLRINKNLEHISVFIDEADQLLPVSPSGARWHLNLWFKDIMRALRKRNISLFLACHGYTDIDGRIRPKVMYRIYMKGACAPSESLVWKTAPITLPQGKYYIERDAWGWARFNKIDEQPRVLVVLRKDDDDEEMRDADQSEVVDAPSSNVKNVVTNIPKDEVVFPVGIEDLPVKIDRQPGEFEPVGPDEDAIPEEFEIIDTDDEFVLKAPDKSSSQPVSAPIDAPNEIPDEEQVEFRAPDEIPIDDLVKETEQPDKKVINNVKPEDPLKDLYD
jgi:energy-coupling factor transporter ATP-binding protein EcfA2